MVKQHRIRCYMDIEVGGVPMGRIVLELFNDISPKTCENFRALCTGEVESGTNSKPLHYISSIFHRIVKGFMIQGGDFTASNGTGGESIYGGFFEDENFVMKHDVPFRLSMANRGKNTNGSQFYITTSVAPHLDGIHVVFGEVKSGQNIVKHLESLPVDRSCRPLQDIKIVKCGELVIKPVKHKAARAAKKVVESSSSDSSSSSSASSSSPLVSKKRKSKRERSTKRKAMKKQTDEVDKEEGELDDTDRHPLVSVSNICPDDIPEVPSNKLLRDDRKPESRSYDWQSRSRPFSRSNPRRPRSSKSGRPIKGRGICRYRTPSRDRSTSPQRSRTPPHWVQAQQRTIKLSDYKKQEEMKRKKVHRDGTSKRDESANGPRREGSANGPRREGSANGQRRENSANGQRREGSAVKIVRDESVNGREPSPKIVEQPSVDSPEVTRAQEPASDDAENVALDCTAALDYNALDYEEPDIEPGKVDVAANSDSEVVDSSFERYRKHHITPGRDSQPDPPEIPLSLPPRPERDNGTVAHSTSRARDSSHSSKRDRKRRDRSRSRDRKKLYSSRESSRKGRSERRRSHGKKGDDVKHGRSESSSDSDRRHRTDRRLASTKR